MSVCAFLCNYVSPRVFRLRRIIAAPTISAKNQPIGIDHHMPTTPTAGEMAYAKITRVPKLLTSPCIIKMPKFMTDCCTQAAEDIRVTSPKSERESRRRRGRYRPNSARLRGYRRGYKPAVAGCRGSSAQRTSKVRR